MLTSSIAYSLVKTNPGYICRSLSVAALVAQTVASSSSIISNMFGVSQISDLYIRKWKNKCDIYQTKLEPNASSATASSYSKNASTITSTTQSSTHTENDESEYRLSYFFAAMTYLGKAKIELANNAFEFYLDWIEKSGLGSDERIHTQRMIYIHTSLALFCNTSLMLETALIDYEHCTHRDKDGISALEANMFAASFYAYSGDYETSMIHYKLATRQVFYDQKVFIIIF